MFDDVEALVDLAAEVFANEGTGTGRWFCLVKIGGKRFCRAEAGNKGFPDRGAVRHPQSRCAGFEPQLGGIAEQFPKPFRPPPFESEGAAVVGAGMYRRRTANRPATPPSGTQLASPIRPPFRHTRASSSAAASGSATNMTPNVDETRAKALVAKRQSLRVTNPEVDFRRHSTRRSASSDASPPRQSPQRHGHRSFAPSHRV
jgi:hypothetical protein